MKAAKLHLICCVLAAVLPASLPAYDVALSDAPRVHFPGVVGAGSDPNAPGDIDCSSPAHWDGDTLYMFYSTGHPFRSFGPDLFHLSRPSQRVTFDNETG
jgi:hypothetical protein